ncbi:MAG: hypothetical protein IH840_10435 [Candidatus Heimdallarchaeota archaeon]|nr:hypothetical protein [Candidatus Heimdallarchaeota archaeon]
MRLADALDVVRLVAVLLLPAHFPRLLVPFFHEVASARFCFWDRLSLIFFSDFIVYSTNHEALDLAYRLAASGPATPENLMRIGEGWIAEEAFVMTMYCVLKYPDDFQKCMSLL